MTERFNVFDIDGTIFLEDHKKGSYHIGEIGNVDVNCLNDIADRLNELNDELMDLRAENTQFKLVVSEIIRDMQKLVDEDQIVYINQSYVDWIKDNVDTELNAELK